MSPHDTSKSQRGVKLLTLGLTIVCLVFLGWSALKLMQSGEGLHWGPLHGLLLGVVAVLYAALFVGLSLLFWVNIRVVSGLSLPRGPVAGLFLTTNLARYLPGNVFHLVGRHVQLNRAYQVPHGDLGIIQVLDLGMILLANLVLGTLAVLLFPIPEWQTVIATHGLTATTPWIGLAAVIVAVVVVVALVWGRHRIPILSRLLRLKTVNAMGLLFLATTTLYLFYGLLFALQCSVLFPDNVEGRLGTILGSFSLAFLLGFVLPGAPGGLGVREAILVLCLSSTLGEAGALEVALLFRASTLLGDAISGGIGFLLGGKTRESTDG